MSLYDTPVEDIASVCANFKKYQLQGFFHTKYNLSTMKQVLSLHTLDNAIKFQSPHVKLFPHEERKQP